MKPYFYRKDKNVWIAIDSGLGTCAPTYCFGYPCDTQEEAELLTRHMDRELTKYQAKIAKDPIMWLQSEEISALKRKLQDWHGGKHCWK